MANTIQIKRGLEADRSGVTPAAGELLYTTDTKQVFVGDGSTAGGNVISGGGAAIEATASGALANGDLVIVNSDGTVSVVAGFAEATGSPTVYESAEIAYSAGTYDTANQAVVITYVDVGNSDYATAVVGTISGTSITFGTPVVYYSNTTYNTDCVYDASSGKVVFCFRAEASTFYGKSVVGTVSGSSITFGSVATFNSSTTLTPRIVYDSGNSKVIITYTNSSNYGVAIVGTVSGTSISFGSAVVFKSNYILVPFSTFDSTNGKIAIIYRDVTVTGTDDAIVGTVSGTSISFGSSVNLVGLSTSNLSIGFDSDNAKVIACYTDTSNSNRLTAKVGTISGTSISFGSAVVVDTVGTNEHQSVSYNASAGLCVFAYRNTSNGDLYFNTGVVSGTSITMDTSQTVSTDNASYIDVVYCSSDNMMVLSYSNETDSTGEAFTFRSGYSNLTSNNFIGISDGAYADTATATIQTAGAVDDAQTGLTAGQAYYVQDDGTLSTTAGDPSVFAGTAISSTKLIVKG